MSHTRVILKGNHLTIPLFIFLSVLLLTPQTFGEIRNDTLLVKIDLMGPMDILKIPIYANVKGNSGEDYVLVFATMDELSHCNMPYTIIDDPLRKERVGAYLLALPLSNQFREAVKKITPILYDDGKHILLSASLKNAEKIAALGCRISWLNAPLINTPKKSLIRQETLIDSPELKDEISKILKPITPQKIHELMGNFSGRKDDRVQKAREWFESLGLSTMDHMASGNQFIWAEKKGDEVPHEIILITAQMKDDKKKDRFKEDDYLKMAPLAVMASAMAMKRLSFKRTIRFILFTGQEKGFSTSLSYADTVSRRDERILAVLNMDGMRGFGTKESGIWLHTRQGVNSGFDSDMVIASAFVHTVQTFGLEDQLTPSIYADGMGFSDHTAFWNKGYPALLIMADDRSFGKKRLNPLNMNFMTASIKALSGTAAQLAIPVASSENGLISYDLRSARKSEKNYFMDRGLVLQSDGLLDSIFDFTNAPEYCASRGENTSYEWLNTVEVDGVTYTPINGGKDAFKNGEIFLKANIPIEIKLSPGFASDVYTEYFSVWIDLNGDGDFLDANENVFEDAGNHTVSGTFKLPGEALSGPSMMRVAMQYNRYANPCDLFSFGEVQDFMVMVEEDLLENNIPEPEDYESKVMVPMIAMRSTLYQFEL